MAGRAELNTLYFNLFSATEHRLLERKSKVALQAFSPLRSMLSRLPEDVAKTLPEGLKNISQSTKAKIGETTLNVYPTKAVISIPFLGVGKDLKGLVYFLKFLLGSWLFVTVRMVLEG
jgi:hypothetical protein